MRRIIQTAVLCVTIGASTLAVAQSHRDKNARLLKSYMAPRTISILEWELLQTNLLWEGTFVGSVNYVTSFPVIYDAKNMRFRATFTVQEKRDYGDREPFFKLPRPKRESILQGAIDQLKELLATAFPEVKNNQGLLYAEFWFNTPNGGRSVVAKYENGILELSD